MKFALFTLLALVSSSYARADVLFCELILTDESMGAANYIIDLNDDQIGEAPKKPSATDPASDQPSEKIRAPELELPLQIVPPSPSRNQRPVPPGPSLPVDIGPLKKPTKYSVN